jgi:hypothetical protein
MPNTASKAAREECYQKQTLIDDIRTQSRRFCKFTTGKLRQSQRLMLHRGNANMLASSPPAQALSQLYRKHLWITLGRFSGRYTVETPSWKERRKDSADRLRE